MLQFDLTADFLLFADEHVVFIQPTGVQRSLCQRVISNHYARMQESQTLQTLMMLQKVCNSPGLLILRMQKVKHIQKAAICCPYGKEG